MNKTALQQLMEQVEMAEELSSMNYLVSWDVVKNLIKNKLPIEREQIEGSYNLGTWNKVEKYKSGKDYFTKTYEQ
jgi:UDP-N-acetylglucosamine transferase subunit ALG13